MQCDLRLAEMLGTKPLTQTLPFLLLLVHELPVTTLVGSMMAFFYFHMFGQLLPATVRLLHSLRRCCDLTLLMVQVVISPLDGVLEGTHLFYSAAGLYTYPTAGLVFYYPFSGGWCCRHPWSKEQYISNQHYCRLNRPYIVR